MTEYNLNRSGRKNYPLFVYTRPVLAFLVVLLSFAFLFSLIFLPIPPGNISTVNLVVGFVLGVTGTVVTYYFGTSKDKSDKDQIEMNDPTKKTGSDPY